MPLIVLCNTGLGHDDQAITLLRHNVGWDAGAGGGDGAEASMDLLAALEAATIAATPHPS